MGLPLAATPFRAWALTDVEQTIPQRFAQIVAEGPRRVAIKTRTQEWTYAELQQHVMRIAAAILATRGAALETVGLVFDQGAWVNAAILGALQANKIYVPLDPAHPRAQLAGTCSHAEIQLLLADTAHIEPANTLGAALHLPVLNVEHMTFGASFTAADPPPALPSTPAHIFYTSGSTGKPKGVVDSHCNVLHTVLRYTNQLHLHADDRLTLLQAPPFSGMISSLYSALMNGATSYPLDLHTLHPDDLAAWLIAERVSVYHSVPALFRSVLREGRLFPDVRVVRLEGDAAARRDVELFRKHFPRAAVLANGLGTTETNLARQFLVEHDTRLDTQILPVGYAVPDMQVVILDDAGCELDREKVGEIGVRSRYLALGYWKNPQATAEKFLPDPKGGDARIYRTGDMGRLRADGCLEYIGRKDFRVKLRGQFVEPALIEEALLALPDVGAAAVVTRENHRAENELVAFVVPANGKLLSGPEMRAALTAQLPAVMIPARLILLPGLPLTAQRKVDRRALQTMPLDAQATTSDFVAPKNETEYKLARIWENVLGLEPVGVETPFLELGGDSLDALKILARVLDAFQVSLSPLEFFNAPTIGDQAALILTKPTHARTSLAPHLRHNPTQPGVEPQK